MNALAVTLSTLFIVLEARINYYEEKWAIPTRIWEALETHQQLCKNFTTDIYNSTLEKFVVATFIGRFKFTSHDPRRGSQRKPSAFQQSFPQPPITRLEPMTKRMCSLSSADCVHHIFKQLVVTSLEKHDKPADGPDTYPGKTYNVVVIRHKNEKMRALQLFHFQTTAMYYLCYWSILKDDSINEMIWECQMPGNVLQKPLLGTCMLDAVCPDPCCESVDDKCVESDQGVCFQLLKRKSGCLRAEGMRYYQDMPIEEFAKSGPSFRCQCPLTQTWNNQHLACLDEDECLTGKHQCDRATQYCVNRVKGYFCVCRWGHRPVSQFACKPISLEHLLTALHK